MAVRNTEAGTKLSFAVMYKVLPYPPKFRSQAPIQGDYQSCILLSRGDKIFNEPTLNQSALSFLCGTSVSTKAPKIVKLVYAGQLEHLHSVFNFLLRLAVQAIEAGSCMLVEISVSAGKPGHLPIR